MVVVSSRLIDDDLNLELAKNKSLLTISSALFSDGLNLLDIFLSKICTELSIEIKKNTFYNKIVHINKKMSQYEINPIKNFQIFSNQPLEEEILLSLKHARNCFQHYCGIVTPEFIKFINKYKTNNFDGFQLGWQYVGMNFQKNFLIGQKIQFQAKELIEILLYIRQIIQLIPNIVRRAEHISKALDNGYIIDNDNKNFLILFLI